MKKYISNIKNYGNTKISFGFTSNLTFVKSHTVDELHYPLANDQKGTIAIPAVDREGSFDTNEYEKYPIEKFVGSEKILGCELLDTEIRKQLGLKIETPLFASLSYAHPEHGDIGFLEIADKLKTEFSITHTGMYIGEGRTRNSPANYHSKKLKIEGYPALVSTVEMEGVDNDTLSTNLYVVTRLLNESNDGVDFPQNYKQDNFHLLSLNALGAHLRGMLDHSWINKDVDPTQPFIKIIEKSDLLSLYCAEHFWQIVNVALNIPQNEKGYTDFFGYDVGKKLFIRAKEIWAEINPSAPNFPVVPEFEPLWRKECIDSPYECIEVGKATYCKPQTTVDLIRDTIKMFTPWNEVGPSHAIALVLGFKETITSRLGISEQEALSNMSIPIKLISSFFLRTTSMTAAEYKEQLSKDLSQILSKDQTSIRGLVSMLLVDLEDGVEELSVESSYLQFEDAMRESIVSLRGLDPEISFSDLLRNDLFGTTENRMVKYYNPPATIHKITRGFVECNPFVKIKTIGTIMDYRDVSKNSVVENTPNVVDSTKQESSKSD